MTVETPRRLVVIRHAKADWPSVPDHERPLADRGRRDATPAGEWLAATGIDLDLTLCSTAVRTRETWKLVAHELPQRPRTVFDERLYEATLGDLLAVVSETPEDEVRTLALVGHNPGVQALVDNLAGSSPIEDALKQVRLGLPTCAIAILEFPGSWKEIQPGSGTLIAYTAPHAE